MRPPSVPECPCRAFPLSLPGSSRDDTNPGAGSDRIIFTGPNDGMTSERLSMLDVQHLALEFVFQNVDQRDFGSHALDHDSIGTRHAHLADPYYRHLPVGGASISQASNEIIVFPLCTAKCG